MNIHSHTKHRNRCTHNTLLTHFLTHKTPVHTQHSLEHTFTTTPFGTKLTYKSNFQNLQPQNTNHVTEKY